MRAEAEKAAAVRKAKDDADKEARRKAEDGFKGKVNVVLEKDNR